MKKPTLTDRQLGLVMRALLLAVSAGFTGVLILLNLIRINAEIDLPEYAHLGIPVYLAVLIGFLPVFFAIGHFWRIAGVISTHRSVSALLLHDIRVVRNCALMVAAWFTLGLLLFFATFRVFGPPPIVMWGFIELASLSIAVVATAVLRLLSTD